MKELLQLFWDNTFQMLKLNQLGFMPPVRLGTQLIISEISIFPNMILLLVDHLDMFEENILHCLQL